MSARQSRRDRERVRVDLDAAFEEPGRQFFLQALNLSASGVFLASGERPSLAAPVQVVLALPPDGVFVRLAGRVARHASAAEPSGFAVRFERVESGNARLLERFVEEKRASA